MLMPSFSFTPFPELTTQRLFLRQLTDEDAPFIYLLRSDESVNKFLDRQKAASVQEAVAFGSLR